MLTKWKGDEESHLGGHCGGRDGHWEPGFWGCDGADWEDDGRAAGCLCSWSHRTGSSGVEGPVDMRPVKWSGPAIYVLDTDVVQLQ